MCLLWTRTTVFGNGGVSTHSQLCSKEWLVEFPTKIDGLYDIVSIAAGPCCSIYVKSDGTIWGRGYGIPQQGYLEELTLIDIFDDVAEIIPTENWDFFCIKKDKTLWLWGDKIRNSFGKDEYLVSISARIPELNHVTKVATSSKHTLVLTQSGSVGRGEKIPRERSETVQR